MSTVQFRWVDNDGYTRIVGQFDTDWIFEEGKTFEFWGSLDISNQTWNFAEE